MSDHVTVQYVGFNAKALVREYAFSVREAACEPRAYTLTIANEAFVSHRVRYQDGPDICSLKLHLELSTHGNHPPKTHYRVTDEELDAYRDAHTPRARRNPYTRRERQDF